MKTIFIQGQFKSRIIMLMVIISLSFLSPAAQVKASTSKLADPFFPLEEEQSFLKTTAFNNNDMPPEGFLNIDSNRIETFTMNMPQLDGREKDIIVYLPADYFSSDKAYPVIYLQNAEEVFIYNRNEDEGGSWILNEALYTFFTANFESEVIIVGAVSDPIFIWEEYGPWVNENMYLWMDPYEANRVEGGQGDAYLDFLIQTLKPEIDNRYQTLPDRDNTAIGGYDMGGLLSLYAGLTRSEVYSRVMALSPAIWFGEKGGKWLSNNRLLNLIERIKIPKNLSLYIDVADSEKTTEIEIRPAVNDAQGKKISFPRAYLEGAQVFIKTLLTNGFAEVNLKTGLVEREIFSIQATEEDSTLDQIYYFPIIFSPPTPSRFESFRMNIYEDEEDRIIWVYLPPNYRNKDQGEGYDVIYLTGVQFIFGTEIGSYSIHDWKFDETLDRLYSDTGIGVIAVGIESSTRHPWDEYTPFDNNHLWRFVNDADTVTGNADAFLDMIVTKLKLRIDDKYNTNPERENTAIGGGSRHAFFALYAGLTKPDIFSGVMAMSPAVWMANDSDTWLKNNRFLNWTPPEPSFIVNYYLYVGGQEWSGINDYPPPGKPILKGGTQYPFIYKDGVDKTLPKLEDYGPIVGNDYLPTGGHLPSLWGTYVDDALRDLGFFQ